MKTSYLGELKPESFRFSLRMLITTHASMTQCSELWLWLTGCSTAWGKDIVSWEAEIVDLVFGLFQRHTMKRFDASHDEFRHIVADVLKSRNNFPTDLLMLTAFHNTISREHFEENEKVDHWNTAVVRCKPGGYVIDCFQTNRKG